MTRREEIEAGKSTFYHELGHLLGYVLFNKSEATQLGPVESVHIRKENST